MPLPKEVDAKVRAALTRVVAECTKLVEDFQRCSDAPSIQVPNPALKHGPFLYEPDPFVPEPNPLWHLDVGQFETARNNVLAVLAHIGGGWPPIAASVQRISALKPNLDGAKALRGILDSARESYQDGLFEPIFAQIERALAGDYLAQAQDLLDEGQRGKMDHVPAAVLLGAVFEKKIRALCAGQLPPIDIKTQDGHPKKVVVLIDALKKPGVYGETKAKELRWIAGVRNHAAHGEFDQFTRGDVEKMRTAVGQFVEDT
jgi:hypothetical protein